MDEEQKGEIAVVEDTTVTPSIPTTELTFADVEGAKRFMENYQELVDALLDNETDYQGGKKKKSAWRKLATAFNISDDIIHDEETRDETGQIVSAKFFVKAILPNGRSCVGVGKCSIYDKIRYTATKKFPADTETPSNFVLRGRFTNAEHDVPATAHTRAKSRAISDLIGAGEVSAEELDDVHVRVTRSSRNDNVSQDTQSSVSEDKPKRTARRTRRTPKTESQPEIQEAEVIETTAKEVNEEESSSTSNSFNNLAEQNDAVKKAINRITEGGDELTKMSLIDELFALYDIGDITEDEYFEAKKIVE